MLFTFAPIADESIQKTTERDEWPAKAVRANIYHESI